MFKEERVRNSYPLNFLFLYYHLNAPRHEETFVVTRLREINRHLFFAEQMQMMYVRYVTIRQLKLSLIFDYQSDKKVKRLVGLFAVFFSRMLSTYKKFHCHQFSYTESRAE